jgi:DNA processing protein
MLLSLMEASRPAWAPVVPQRELGAYEALWLDQGATFKSIADRFSANPDALPSNFVPDEVAYDCARQVLDRFKQKGIDRF